MLLVEPRLSDLPTSETWIKDRGHFTEPITPFGASIYFPARAHETERAFAEFGLLTERVEMLSRAGDAYLRTVPMPGLHPISGSGSARESARHPTPRF